MAARQGFSGTVTWYDPGHDAAQRHPEWVIRHHSGLHVPEVMCTRRKVILLERDARRSERRGNLAHAVAHIDLEHMSASGPLNARQERAADVLAARRLVGLVQLSRAWMAAESLEGVAETLEVSLRLLRLRLDTLRKAERERVREVLTSKEWAS